MKNNTTINIEFDDSFEVNATREVLEDLLSRQYVKDNLSVYDYKRVKDLAKQLWRNTTINSDDAFFYRGYVFTLVKIHVPTIADKVICFITGNTRDTSIPWYSENDILIPWCSEITDIVETGKMPPDDLLKAIDNYLDSQEETADEE